MKETIEDIVRDIRSRNDGGVPLDGESSHCLAADMLELADRIEAAVKYQFRDVTKMETTTPTCDKSSQVQPLDMAKSRAALETLVNSYDKDSHTYSMEVICKAHEMAIAALAEPLKNCEVGTAEEQSVRFYDYCLTHSKSSVVCLDCPLCDKSEMCEFAWANMPYESEGK
jgi:hypothetical protein